VREGGWLTKAAVTMLRLQKKVEVMVVMEEEREGVCSPRKTIDV